MSKTTKITQKHLKAIRNNKCPTCNTQNTQKNHTIQHISLKHEKYLQTLKEWCFDKNKLEKVSQEAIAKKLGLTRATIKKWITQYRRQRHKKMFGCDITKTAKTTNNGEYK